MMVARDGDEPPTPAFSDLVQPTPLTTYRFAGNCQLPANTIVEFLGDTNADVFILQEVDVNARRTHHLNIAQEIARKLRLNYVFGREFVELTQGSRSNPAFHGQATLSPWKISKPRIIHFQRQSDFWKPRWFKPTLSTFQERLGGRVALACEISTQGVSIVSYNLHLESRFQ
jgi:endonuclease/exonuclease/phosphatase family metal-dependent hydrolase